MTSREQAETILEVISLGALENEAAELITAAIETVNSDHRGDRHTGNGIICEDCWDTNPCPHRRLRRAVNAFGVWAVHR